MDAVACVVGAQSVYQLFMLGIDPFPVHIRRKKSHTVIGEKEGGLYLILPQIPPPRFQPFNRRRRNIRKKLMGIIGIFIHIHAEIIDTPQITR